MQRSHVVAGSLVVLGACAALVWFLAGGGEAPQPASHGTATHTPAHVVGDGAALASHTSERSSELASAERSPDARAALDDRRTWSATLAFAPDMAWLAPQLVWRARAAGGDGDDVLEPLAPLPHDADGDGVIELALRVPPARHGERVALDLHIREGSVPCVATLDVTANEARVQVGWSDVPLVAAGFIRDHGLVGERLRHEQIIVSYDEPVVGESPELARWRDIPVQTIRGSNGEFALFAAPLPKPGRSGSVWMLWLEHDDRIVSSSVGITVGQTGVLVEVDRGGGRVVLVLDPAFEYPGMVLRIDDVRGTTVVNERIDDLRGRTTAEAGRAVVEFEGAAGTAAFALADAALRHEPLAHAAPTPIAFAVPRGTRIELPTDGPLDVIAHPDVAVLRLTAADSVRVQGTWVCGESRRTAFDFRPRAGPPIQPVATRSLALLVPRDAERIEIEAPGHQRVVVDAWRRAERDVLLEPIEPARITFDWSECDVRELGGTVEVQFWTFRAERKPASTEPTNSHEFIGMSSATRGVGTNDAIELAVRDDVEFATVIVRWAAPSEGETNTRAHDRGQLIQVRDITSDGTTYFVWDAWNSLRGLRLQSGREYVIHLTHLIPRAP